MELNDELLLEVKAYIENNTNLKLKDINGSNSFKMPDIGCCEDRVNKIYSESEIKEILGHSSDTFQEYFFYLVRKNGLNLDTIVDDLKINKDILFVIGYNPTYKEALRAALSFNLNLDEVLNFIGRSGYFINKNESFDLVIRYAISKNIKDINLIDNILKFFELESIYD